MIKGKQLYGIKKYRGEGCIPLAPADRNETDKRIRKLSKLNPNYRYEKVKARKR